MSFIVKLSLVWLSLFSLHGLAQPAFSFAAIGDVPYGKREAYWARAMLQEMDQEDLKFVLHIGDLKSSREPCTDELLIERRDLLASTRHALIYLPGDNEWSDCDRHDTSFHPGERLEKLRELFYPDDQTLGGTPFKVQRQSEIAKFRQYRENMRWQIGNVLFVGLNVSGSNNNYRKEAGRNGEFEERLVANQFWLQRAFALAKQRNLAGLVIAFQANPLFEGAQENLQKIFQRDGYLELRQQIIEQTQQFAGQVLIIHGDTHRYRYHQPLEFKQGRIHTLPNLSRLEVFGSPSALNWVKVNVDPTQATVFQIEVRQIPASPMQ